VTHVRAARRARVDRLVTWVAGLAFAALLAPVVGLFVWSFVEAFARGGFELRLLAALASSLELCALALLLGLPTGLFAGAHLAELASPRVARSLRFVADVLAGAPPLLFGVLVHATVAAFTGASSLVPSALALGLLVAPPIARATEELLALVPEGLREAALGLGLPPWRVVLFVALPSLRPSLGGVALALGARAIGEAAPLLFTAGVVRGLGGGLFGESPSLALGLHAAMSSAEPGEQGRAWAAAFVLLVVVVASSWLGRSFAEPRT
jgi:phosphate transport system permease protein